MWKLKKQKGIEQKREMAGGGGEIKEKARKEDKLV